MDTNTLSRLLRSAVILRIKWRIGREGKSMGGTNPDTLSGATITVERRTGQMEARALGGPSYLSYIYMPGFVYNALALRDSPRGLSFDSLGFPLHTSAARGEPRVSRHEPYDGADGLATPRGVPRPTTPCSFC